MSETQLFFIFWTDTWNQISNSRYLLKIGLSAQLTSSIFAPAERYIYRKKLVRSSAPAERYVQNLQPSLFECSTRITFSLFR